MTERHYSDDEVAAIFHAAAEGSASRTVPANSASGLTLRDLQDIARQVDIPADAIARAARALDSSRTPTVSPTLLGFPAGVQRVAALSRRLTDDEWELLVVDLRQTFNARGTVRSHGSLREWSNGNLHALLEPTPTGHQLRLTTFKSNARTSVAAGVAVLAVSAVAAVLAAVTGSVHPEPVGIALMAVFGTGIVATNLLRLPAWARLRGQQMDAIVERVATEQDSPT